MRTHLQPPRPYPLTPGGVPAALKHLKPLAHINHHLGRVFWEVAGEILQAVQPLSAYCADTGPANIRPTANALNNFMAISLCPYPARDGWQTKMLQGVAVGQRGGVITS